MAFVLHDVVRGLNGVCLACAQVTDEGVSMLALMCDLRELSLRENGISDDALASLAHGATNLRVLDLSRCKVCLVTASTLCQLVSYGP
jgi:hypothetical protein